MYINYLKILKDNQQSYFTDMSEKESGEGFCFLLLKKVKQMNLNCKKNKKKAVLLLKLMSLLNTPSIPSHVGDCQIYRQDRIVLY